MFTQAHTHYVVTGLTNTPTKQSVLMATSTVATLGVIYLISQKIKRKKL
jgi:hypothetical protein